MTFCRVLHIQSDESKRCIPVGGGTSNEQRNDSFTYVTPQQRGEANGDRILIDCCYSDYSNSLHCVIC